MKITPEQFDQAQKTFSKKSLSDIEKRTMLSEIYSKQGGIMTKQTAASPSPYLVFFRQKVFVTLVAVILLVASTTYASAMSLPGDLLYGMKVKVIEPLELSLRFSEEAKNEFRMFLLQKRVEELERLEQRGGANNDSQKASSEATNKNIKELENSAIFDEKGENVEVSQKLEIYNNLIDDNLRIETKIKKESDKPLNTEADIKIEESVEVESKDNLPLDIESGPDIETEILGL